MAVIARRALQAAAVAAALLAVAAGPSAAASTSSPVRIGVAGTALTAPLPENFLGIAMETRTVPQWVGNATTPAQVDPVLVGLVRTLAPTGAPVIRIGGESTDRSWWPVPGIHTPRGITETLDPAWATDLRSFAEAAHARLLVGINLEANSVAVSRYEADQLLHRIGKPYLSALEIGNEQALYRSVPWYEDLNGKVIPWYDRKVGTPIYSRPPSYDETDFLSEFQRTLAALPPHTPIAGPDALGTNWLPAFDRLASRGGQIRVLDSHSYALQSCVSDPASPLYPSIPHLLAVRSWTHILNGTASSIALAHRDGLQFRIDEMGSVTCQGRVGVSNTMASALWVSNALMYAARQGISGVNLHTYPGVSNDLFDISDGPHGWSAVIHPIYDGTAMFARAAPAGSRELRLSGAHPSTLQTWATIGADHQVRVLVVNSGSQRTETVQAPAGFGTHPGSLQRLLAPSVSATSGLTLGGQPVDSTTTGALPAPTLVPVAPSAGGYTFTAPADSETLLTLSRQ